MTRCSFSFNSYCLTVQCNISGSTDFLVEQGINCLLPDADLVCVNLMDEAILGQTQHRISFLVKSHTVTDCKIVGNSQFSISIGISLLFLPAER